MTSTGEMRSLLDQLGLKYVRLGLQFEIQDEIVTAETLSVLFKAGAGIAKVKDKLVIF